MKTTPDVKVSTKMQFAFETFSRFLIDVGRLALKGRVLDVNHAAQGRKPYAPPSFTVEIPPTVIHNGAVVYPVSRDAVEVRTLRLALAAADAHRETLEDENHSLRRKASETELRMTTYIILFEDSLIPGPGEPPRRCVYTEVKERQAAEDFARRHRAQGRTCRVIEACDVEVL